MFARTIGHPSLWDLRSPLQIRSVSYAILVATAALQLCIVQYSAAEEFLPPGNCFDVATPGPYGRSIWIHNPGSAADPACANCLQDVDFDILEFQDHIEEFPLLGANTLFIVDYFGECEDAGDKPHGEIVRDFARKFGSTVDYLLAPKVDILTTMQMIADNLTLQLAPGDLVNLSAGTFEPWKGSALLAAFQEIESNKVLPIFPKATVSDSESDNANIGDSFVVVAHTIHDLTGASAATRENLGMVVAPTNWTSGFVGGYLSTPALYYDNYNDDMNDLLGEGGSYTAPLVAGCIQKVARVVLDRDPAAYTVEKVLDYVFSASNRTADSTEYSHRTGAILRSYGPWSFARGYGFFSAWKSLLYAHGYGRIKALDSTLIPGSVNPVTEFSDHYELRGDLFVEDDQTLLVTDLASVCVVTSSPEGSSYLGKYPSLHEIRVAGLLDVESFLVAPAGQKAGVNSSIIVDPAGEVRVRSGGVITISSGQILDLGTNSVVVIESGGTVVVESGGTLSQEPTAVLQVDPGAILDLQPGSIVFPAILMEDESTTSNLLSGGVPYSSAVLDFDGDGDQDIIASVTGHTAKLFELTFFDEGVSVFASRDFFPVFPALTSEDHRGVSVCDYDNDGDPDLFLAHETSPRLYRNEGDGTFSDQSSATGIAGFAIKSWSGSWGDYDKDGYPDLYVTRAIGTPPVVNGSLELTPDWIDGQGLPDVLLRNTLGDGGSGFVDVTVSAGMDVTNSETVTASWTDVDNDGWLDLYVGWLGPVDGGATLGWSPLYINQKDGTFVDRAGAGTAPTFPKLGYVSAVSWGEFNRDGYSDIVLARQNESGGGISANTLLCLNGGVAAPGDLTEEPTEYGIYSEALAQNVQMADLDLNSFTDLVSVPTGSAGAVLIYLGFAAGTDIRYRESASALGLSSGKVDGLLIADLNVDGDGDLYLGRDDNSSRYFQNRAQDGSENSPNNYIQVVLRAEESPGSGWRGGNNFYGYGCRVTLSAPSASPELTLQQIVDGGSGRGGQASGILSFGLGSHATGTVVVDWPDGTNRSYDIPADISLNNAASPTILRDNHVPSIDLATVIGYPQPTPAGKVDFVVTWETRRSTHRDFDVVVLRPKASHGSVPPHCQTFGETTLDRYSPFTVYSYQALSDGNFLHTLRWENQTCSAPCDYEFTVQSGVGSDIQVTSWNTFSVPVCTP